MAKKKAAKKPAAVGKTTILGGMVEIIGLPKKGREKVAAAILRGIGEGKASEPVLKPGTPVRWAGGEWKVVEWQPENGVGGSYWLKNRRGDSGVAGPREVTVIKKRRAKR